VSQSRPTYRATTRAIDVEVEPFYLQDQSDPADQRWVWGYRITIANKSDRFIQVLARHWRITDGLGRVEEVSGPGVVGEQPELNPGDSFQYTSGCPLRTPSGIMVGTYTVRDGDGAFFDIDIPAFSLDLPDRGRSLN
jgi:ApaG protein